MIYQISSQIKSTIHHIVMELIDPTNQTTRLQTAWILATLGFKVSTKKPMKKDIIIASIPQVCQDLIDICHEKNIRYSANILYGISLIYKSKISYIVNEILLISTKLKRELIAKTLISSTVQEYEETSFSEPIHRRAAQIYLLNDAAFDVRYFPPLPYIEEGELPQHKRRKMEIRRLDYELFGSTEETAYHETSIEFGNLSFNGGTTDSVDLTFDLDYSSQGADQSQLNFDLGDLNNISLHEDDAEVNRVNITNDPNFHLSTIDNQTATLELSNKGVKRSRALVKDVLLQWSTSEVAEFAVTYESRMITNVEPNRLLEIAQAITSQNNRKFNNLITHLSGETDQSLLHSMSRMPTEIDMENTEHEFGRNMQAETSPVRDIFPLEEGYDYNFDAGEQEDIFNLSFGDLDGERISRGSSGYEYEESFLEEEIATLNKQLSRFYTFLMNRSEVHGTRFTLSLIELQELTDSSKKYVGTNFMKISFSKLIPNISAEETVSRKLAANSFACVLALTSRNIIGLSVGQGDENGVKGGESIEVFFQCQASDNER